MESGQSGKLMEGVAMKKIRLTREYLAGPLFCPDIELMSHIDICDLNISMRLKDKINSWDIEYQSTYNDEYPPDSGFRSIEDKRRHEREGKEIARLLQEELGGGIVVEYVP